MQIKVASTSVQKTPGSCLVIGIYSNNQKSPSAAALDKLSGNKISKLKKSGDAPVSAGETLLLPEFPGVNANRILLVGLGEQKKFTSAVFRNAMACAAKRLHKATIRDAAFFAVDANVNDMDTSAKTKHLVEAVIDAVYRFDQLKKEKNKPGLSKLNIVVSGKKDEAAAKTGASQGKAIAEGVKLAKELGNLPGNICTPSYLANRARSLGRSHKLKVKILSEADMKKLGMGSLLSVSRGSRQPAKLIIMEYTGGKKNSAPVALVGKGLTFDAGGISLKPAGKMDEMKYDMCGSASVFGTLLAAAEMKLPINVIGVVPSSENLPDGDANKPGDVVTSMSGQTIEILNTDAEGRLILCDALTYTERFKPKAVIDIATLTGACVVALGAHASGLFSNDQALADELLEAGQTSGDRAWQMPVWDDYQKQLNSNFADMANVGGRDAGAVTAACFLARYTKAFKWAHLDIAGTAWKSGAQKGATGRPVPLLTQYLINQADNK